MKHIPIEHTPEHGGSLHQLSWLMALVRPLIEDKFFGELHLTFQDGQIKSGEKQEKIKPPDM